MVIFIVGAVGLHLQCLPEHRDKSPKQTFWIERFRNCKPLSTCHTLHTSDLPKDLKKRMLIGVNFDGVKIAERQNRQKAACPSNYISDSFRIFSEKGLNCIRIPFYWESFEKDPEGFIQELEVISEEADKNGLGCIYDNHQWECSSSLGYGIGFPSSLLCTTLQRKPPTHDSRGPPNKRELEMFWNKWWDRKVVNSENRDGWELQRDLLQRVISKMNNKKSTLGFEILNEPQVYRNSDFTKVSWYHNFMVENLEKHTEKPFFFSYAYSNSIRSFGFPWRQSKIRPTVKSKNKIIFDVHPYPPYYIVLLYYKLVSALMKNGIMFAGEFNSGVNENAAINPKQHSQYIKRFLGFSLYGATFWRWSYEIDKAHPAFNLTKVAENRICPNENFASLVKSVTQ